MTSSNRQDRPEIETGRPIKSQRSEGSLISRPPREFESVRKDSVTNETRNMNWPLLLLTCSIGVLLVAFVYFGIFPPGNPSQKMLESFELLYRHVDVRPGESIPESLRSLEKELQATQAFQKCQLVRMRLDEEVDPRPEEVKEAQRGQSDSSDLQSRLIVGYVIASEATKEEAKRIMNANPSKYRLKRFPRTLAMSFGIPWRNELSFHLVPYCWERILKTLITEGLGKKAEEYYSLKLEFFSPSTFKKKQIEVYHPLEHQKQILELLRV